MIKKSIKVEEGSILRTDYTGLQEAIDVALRVFGKIYIVSASESYRAYYMTDSLMINPSNVVGYITEMDANSPTVDVYLDEARIPEEYNFDNARVCLLTIADAKHKEIKKIVKGYILSSNGKEIN